MLCFSITANNVFKEIKNAVYKRQPHHHLIATYKGGEVMDILLFTKYRKHVEGAYAAIDELLRKLEEADSCAASLRTHTGDGTPYYLAEQGFPIQAQTKEDRQALEDLRKVALQYLTEEIKQSSFASLAELLLEAGIVEAYNLSRLNKAVK